MRFNIKKQRQWKTIGTLVFVSVLLVSLVYGLISSKSVLAFSGGSGTSGSPYQITTAAQLASLSSYLGSSYSGDYFILENNISLSGYSSGSGWTPIGNSSSAFDGHFNGNYYTVSGLYINNASSSYLGLFGETGSTASIQDVVVNINSINGATYIGGLVGYNNGGTVQYDGDSGGSVTGTGRVGGLVGSDSGAMAYDYSNTSVVFDPGGSVTCCVGGLTGEVAFGSSSATIHDSYSRSSVYIGTSSIYDQGSVGGLLGNDYNSGAKSNLYSTGPITIVSGGLPGNTGGLSGGQYTSITTSYWDKSTSGLSTSDGGAGVIGYTTSTMKTQGTYSGWNFSTIWGIDGTGTINNGYPYLLWQNNIATNPNSPSSLGGSTVISGSYSTTSQPTFNFNLSDQNSSTNLKYEIQVSTNSSYTSPVIDYTSALAAEGSASFTVGQSAGGGTYTTGSSGQTLADGTYYWQVRALDGSGDASSYTQANSGSVAFGVDTTAPTVPGIPSTITPTNTASPNVTWSASTDSGSGLSNTVPYILEVSSTSNFSTSITYYNASTNSVSVAGLSDGTWYMKVIAYDALGNASSASPTGSFVLDTTAPTVPGTPSTNSPTSNTSPTWTWTASTDTGTGLAAFPYTVQWSKSSNFSSGIYTDTTSTNSYMISTTLSDGTWYFRVEASDVVGNNSSFSTKGTVIVDSTPPTTPGIPTTNSLSTNNKPTWTWTASTDSGTGLAASPYTVEWSESPTFSSGIFSSPSSTNSFTQSSALADGTWYFRVEASDQVGNTSTYSGNGSLTIDTYVAPTPSPTSTTPTASTNSSSKSSPSSDVSTSNLTTTPTSSSSSDDTSTASTVLLNNFENYVTGVGQSLQMAAAQAVSFKVQTQLHTATVLNVSNDSAVIVLHSKPIMAKLSVGQTKEFDVTGSGKPEISITLQSVNNGVAHLVFAEIKQPATVISTKSSKPISFKIAAGAILLIILIIISISVEKNNHKKEKTFTQN